LEEVGAVFEGCRALVLTEEVAVEVHRLMQAAYRVEADLLGVREFVPLRRTVADLLRATSTFLGAFPEGRLAAVVELEHREGEPLNVASLVVMPGHFRRGLGTALMRRVLEEHGKGPMTVSTGVRNLPALRLYANLGFQEQRRWSVDGIPMVTLLRPGG
jgi:ribosomal protein S18 acetylase RimI-like enzyme